MPTKAYWIFCSLICLAGVVIAAEPKSADDRWYKQPSYEDRYAQWRRERTADANEPAEPAHIDPDVARELPQDEDREAATPEDSQAEPGPPDAWQSPAKEGSRKLPMRFERAQSTGDGTKVIRASATSEAKPIPLRPRQPEATPPRRARPEMPSIVTVAGSLAVVVGLFLIVAWAMRRSMPRQAPLLPREALEVLGRQRVVGKQEVHLVRLGNKLLLLSIMPGGTEMLAEITDPLEVDRLTGLCYQAHRHSSSKRFQQMFQQFANERPAAQRSATSSSQMVGNFDLSSLETGSSKSRRRATSLEEFDG